MSCQCDYRLRLNTPCISCVNQASNASANTITQKKIWNQVRTGSAIYTMNLGAITSGASILASGSNVNWNQRSDRVLAATQPSITSTHGNSVRNTLTSGRPGAGNPGGSGVDVKHDSYARYLNRKKAGVFTPKTTTATPVYGNKNQTVNLVANTMTCCR